MMISIEWSFPWEKQNINFINNKQQCSFWVNGGIYEKIFRKWEEYIYYIFLFIYLDFWVTPGSDQFLLV